jgi:putative membrane protein
MTGASSVVTAMAVAIALSTAPRAAAQAPDVARAADPARSADVAFLAKATEAAGSDAELARLGAQRAKTPSVKAFAKLMLDAHAALAKELDAMAGTRQITNVPHVDTPSKAAVSLRSQPPAAFDAAFVAAMIASRTAAVALFETESRDGRDDEVKEWAARQLPALRDHLAAARALRPGPSS